MPQPRLDTRGQRSPAAPFVVRAHSLGGGGGGNGGQQQQRPWLMMMKLVHIGSVLFLSQS